MKKIYQLPSITVIMMQHRQMLLDGSVQDVDGGDTGIGYGGGGNGGARSRGFGEFSWDESAEGDEN